MILFYNVFKNIYLDSFIRTFFSYAPATERTVFTFSLWTAVLFCYSIYCSIKPVQRKEDTKDMPDSYVIFITENDVMKGDLPLYPVERYVTIGENKVLFGDGSHILYVNGKYRGNDEIGKLMHDFSCINPDDMNFEALA